MGRCNILADNCPGAEKPRRSRMPTGRINIFSHFLPTYSAPISTEPKNLVGSRMPMGRSVFLATYSAPIFTSSFRLFRLRPP